MGTVTVHVATNAGRTAVEAGPERVLVRVRAAPEGGRATDEARRALARVLGVPASRVRLRAGARQRIKVFEVDGMSSVDIEVGLRGT